MTIGASGFLQLIHDTADVEIGSIVSRTATIWRHAHICGGAEIGEDVMIGEGVHVGNFVIVGARCRIQNGAQLFEGVALAEDVFVGPHVTFTNVKTPRVGQKHDYEKTTVKRGASIGANATILCGITIGEYAMIGAGSVVTKDVKPFTLVIGNPAKDVGFVCRCGARISPSPRGAIDTVVLAPCNNCNIGLRFTFSARFPYDLTHIEPMDATT